MILDELSHYQLLQLERSFDESALQSAFHTFSETFHPDRHPRADDETKAKLRRIFQRGAEAYRVLRSPRLRSEYDLAWAASRKGSGTTPAVQSLDALCLTPGGRLHARQAERALSEGDMRKAESCLEKAVELEGSNPALQDRLESLRAWLVLSGPPGDL